MGGQNQLKKKRKGKIIYFKSRRMEGSCIGGHLCPAHTLHSGGAGI